MVTRGSHSACTSHHWLPEAQRLRGGRHCGRSPLSVGAPVRRLNGPTPQRNKTAVGVQGDRWRAECLLSSSKFVRDRGLLYRGECERCRRAHLRALREHSSRSGNPTRGAHFPVLPPNFSAAPFCGPEGFDEPLGVSDMQFAIGKWPSRTGQWQELALLAPSPCRELARFRLRPPA